MSPGAPYLSTISLVVGSGLAIAQRHALTCIVTLGSRGVFAVNAHEALAIDAYPVEAIDTLGAGDTFCGVLAASLDRESGLGYSLRRATVA